MAEKKTTQTKASMRNGRATKGGAVYNANHNTLESIRRDQPHIDAQKFELNRYWKFAEEDHKFTIKKIDGGKGGFDARKHELAVYEKLYGDGLAARNERYTREGHKERCQTMKNLYSNPKTAPLETIFQIGNSQMILDGVMGPEEMKQKLTAAWNTTMRQVVGMGKGMVIPLDAALHCEEAVPHIHFRAAMGARDKYGHFVPNQNAALAAMGFDGRNPETGKKDRYHNPLVAYTDRVREIFYAECEKQGLVIDREVTSESHRQKELLAFKCEKYREENQALEQQAREAEASAAEAEARQQRAEEKTQAALEALERVLGDTDTLKAEITALRASQAALEAENEHLTDKKDQTEKALAEVKAQGRELLAQNKQLREENKTLEAKNQKLEDRQGKLEARLEEVTAKGIEISTKNKELSQANEQLRAENRQLRTENDGLMMQLGQLHQEKAVVEQDTDKAKAARAAAVEAAQEMEKHHRYMYEKQHIRSIREYETIPARPEKKNLRGQVTQEARPECVVVAKEDLERTKNQARFVVDTYYTEATIKALDKKISENEIVQNLQAQVGSLETENRQLRWERNSLSQDNAVKQQTIQRQKEVLERFGLTHWAEGGTTQTNTQTNTNDYPNLEDRQ